MDPMLRRTILLLISIFSGCSNGTKTPPIKPKPVQVKTISPTFVFPDSDELKKEYLAKMVTVKKGDKIEDVVQKMASSFRTEPYDLGYIDELYGTKVKYSVGYGIREQYVTFWFGNDDRLMRMSTNMKDVP
jgi:hypothetical protein